MVCHVWVSLFSRHLSALPPEQISGIGRWLQISAVEMDRADGQYHDTIIFFGFFRKAVALISSDRERGTMSAVPNHSTMALLSEKLPKTCGSSMISAAELSSLQVAGGEGYPSYY